MNKEQQPFEALNQIADQIEPFEAAWRKAWAGYSNLSSSVEDLEVAMLDACAKLNAEVDRHVDAIAAITNNSVSTIRQVFGPKPKEWASVWFSPNNGINPSEFLRNVAKYSSFNTNYWYERERQLEKEALLLIAEQADVKSVVSLSAGALEAAGGGVPVIDMSDADFWPVGTTWSPQGKNSFLQAFKAVGLLEQYNPRERDAVSAMKSFAFIIPSGETRPARVCFWPKGRAINHLSVVELEADGRVERQHERA